MGNHPAGLTLPSVAPRVPVSRIGDDRYALRLDAQERKILGALLDELRQAMRERDDAPRMTPAR